MVNELQRLSRIAASFEREGNIAAGKEVTAAMRKIATLSRRGHCGACPDDLKSMKGDFKDESWAAAALAAEKSQRELVRVFQELGTDEPEESAALAMQIVRKNKGQ